MCQCRKNNLNHDFNKIFRIKPPLVPPKGGNSPLSFGEGGGRGLNNLGNLFNLVKIMVQTKEKNCIFAAMNKNG